MPPTASCAVAMPGRSTSSVQRSAADASEMSQRVCRCRSALVARAGRRAGSGPGPRRRRARSGRAAGRRGTGGPRPPPAAAARRGPRRWNWRLTSSTAKPRSCELPDLALDLVAVVVRRTSARRAARPRAPGSASPTLSASVEQRVEVRLVLLQPHGEVEQAAGHVLHQDVDVVPALPVGSASDGSRWSRRRPARPAGPARRARTACWPASSRPRRRRCGAGRPAGSPSRRAAARGGRSARPACASAAAGTARTARGTG